MRDEGTPLDTVRVLEMTMHFEKRLRERLGIDLTLDRLNALLSESKRISRQQTVYRLINGEFRRRKLLAQFWNHKVGVIILIDEWQARAVTIITPRDRLPLHPKAPHDERAPRRRKRFSV